MPFATDEYAVAFVKFTGDVVRELARLRDPLLSRISFEETSGTVASRVQSRDGLNVELDSSRVGFEIGFSNDEIRTFDYDAFVVQIDKASDSYASGIAKMIIEGLDKLTEGTGNVVDAEGKITFEKFFEVLEKMEWPDLDDDGNQVLPELFAGSDAIEAIQSLPDPTPEQQRLLDDQKKRKYEESLARRRSRRLS